MYIMLEEKYKYSYQVMKKKEDDFRFRLSCVSKSELAEYRGEKCGIITWVRVPIYKKVS